jgi:hypothetical protein
MKRIIKLTESDLARIVRRVIREKFDYGNSGNSDLQMIKITHPIFGGYATYYGHLYQNRDGLSFFIPLKDGFEFESSRDKGGDRYPRKVVEKLEMDFNRLVGKKLAIDGDYGGSLEFGEELPDVYIAGLLHGDEGVVMNLV